MGILLFAIAIVSTERLIPRFKTEFLLTHSQAGAILSANMLGFLISILLGGIISDYSSKKRLILAGFLLSGTGGILIFLAKSYFMLLLGGLFIGISGGLLEGILSIVIMLVFKEKPGMAMNLTQIFFGIGAGIAPFFATLFREWRFAYSLIAILSFLLLFVTIPSTIPETRSNEKLKEITNLFTNPLFLLAAMGMFFYSCTETGIVGWISSLFIEELETSKLWGTLSLSAYWFAQFVGRATVGLKVDRFSPEKIISILFFISGLTLSGALTLHITNLSFIFFSLTGFVMAPIWPTIIADARMRFSKTPGAAVGGIAAMGSLAGMIIAPLIGKIADLYTISRGLYLTVATSIAGCLIYIAIILITKASGTRNYR